MCHYNLSFGWYSSILCMLRARKKQWYFLESQTKEIGKQGSGCTIPLVCVALLCCWPLLESIGSHHAAAVLIAVAVAVAVAVAHRLQVILREMEIFQKPRDGKGNIFLVEPRGQRGIHCRFGMPGVRAECI